MNQPKINSTAGCALPPPNEMILKWAAERPNEVYLKQIINRQFVEFTYAEVADQALKLVSALRGLGIQPGDKVALVSKNCAEWFICDLAMMLGDYVSVPIFPTAGDDTIEYCVTHSESKALIGGSLMTQQQLSKSLMPYQSLSASHCRMIQHHNANTSSTL
ncbi:AMP-binding protein [Vibrio parahaemolyticus]